MPALVAMRFYPDLKTNYAALRQAGKPAKVAIIACIGKNSPPVCFLILSRCASCSKPPMHW